MKKLLIGLFLSLLIVNLGAGVILGAEKHEVNIAKVEESPNIDGEIDDKAWKTVKEKDWVISNFVLYKEGNPAVENKKTAYMAYDEEALYITIKINANMEKIKAEITEDKGSLWKDDDAELFLNPFYNQDDKSGYFQLIANSVGARHFTLKNGASWNESAYDNIKVSTKKYEDYWVMEGKVPYFVLGVSAPDSGDIWSGNIAGNQPNQNGWWTYAPIEEGGFHQSQEFVEFKFE